MALCHPCALWILYSPTEDRKEQTLYKLQTLVKMLSEHCSAFCATTSPKLANRPTSQQILSSTLRFGPLKQVSRTSLAFQPSKTRRE